MEGTIYNKTDNSINCAYTNTSYEVNGHKKGSMVFLEIKSPSPLNRLFQETFTIDDAQRILSMINTMIREKEN